MIVKVKKKTKRTHIQPKMVAGVEVKQLAEAIVLAEDLRRQRDEENLKNIGDRPSNMWMKMILTIVLLGVAVVTGLSALGCVFFGGINAYFTLTSSFGVDWRDLANDVMLIMVGLLLALVCFFTILTEKEIGNETDKHYVAAMFSNVVALVALIVSLVALIKG